MHRPTTARSPRAPPTTTTLRSPHAEPAPQHPVVGVGAAAPLDVAEDRGAGLDAGAALDLGRHQVPDPTQADVAVAVELLGHRLERAGLGPGALGHDHDGGPPPGV